MKRQDLLTALVRNPEHTVVVDGFAVTGLNVTASEVILHTAKRAGPADGQAVLEEMRAEHAKEVARLMADAESQLTALRDTLTAEGAAALEQAVAEACTAFAAERDAAVAKAVAEALEAERAKKVDEPAAGETAKPEGVAS